MKDEKRGDNQAPCKDKMKRGEEVFAATAKFVYGLGEMLKSKIKGQRYAIYNFQEAIFEALTVKDERHKGPTIAALLSGLPGVGKTQIVQYTAEYLGLPYRRFNMSSYSDKEESLFNFKGINESYKAARRGDVTQFVDENPNAVILFDEVDKAHTNVLNCMLQILDEGRLEDGFTRKKVSFKNTIIFMTTNVGADLFQDPTQYNYATLAKEKILNSLRNECSPVTGYPCFSTAIVSRFAQGRIIPFNRLDGQTLCEISRARAQELIDVFKGRYPDVDLQCDVELLAKTLLLEKGNNADARNMTGEVEHFFGTHLFDVMQKYEERGRDFSKLKGVRFDFKYKDNGEYIEKMFFSDDKHKVAVFCGEEEKSLFDDCTELDLTFVSFEEKVSSIEYDGVIVSGNLKKNKRGLEFFRKTKENDYIPVHMFTTDENSDEIDMKIFHCEGAESVFMPNEGKTFTEWRSDIAKKLAFAKSLLELARANMVLKNDTICINEEDDEGIILRVDTVNYRLERAVYAEDENAVTNMREIPYTRLSDVIGVDAALNEICELIKEVKNYKNCIRKGRRVPRGALLHGVPGCGKTLIAKAVAGECGLPIFHRNAATLYDQYVGGTQKEIQKLFEQARRYAPSIIFLDEVDAIAKARGSYQASVSSELALNTLLSEMDGFTRDEKRPVFVIAATNFDPTHEKTALDKAFIRRFDRRINVGLPDAKGRLDILQFYLKKYSVDIPDASLTTIVDRSQGKSPADLVQIVDLALRLAENDDVTIAHLEEAFETVVFGDKKKWNVDVMKKTSYHEAGHALIACLTGKTPTFVTNISRGNYGGYMQSENGEERLDYTRQDILDKICVSFAGRAAEQMIYGVNGLTTGAGSDLKHARELAYMLLNDYAMDEDFLLGMGDVQSETTKQMFDSKANLLLKEQYARATNLLQKNKGMLDKLADALMQEHSLNARRINEVLQAVEGTQEECMNVGE